MTTNEDFFRIIGHVSVLFATLDLLVSEVVVRLTLGRPKQIGRFSENATLGQKLGILKQLEPADVTNRAVLVGLQQQLPRFESAARERNRYVHDQWIFDPSLVAQGTIRRVKLLYGARLRGKVKQLTMEDLESFLRSPSGMGELPRLQATPSGGLRLAAAAWNDTAATRKPVVEPR